MSEITFANEIMKWLESNGMFPSQAEEVLVLIQEQMPEFDRWEDAVEGYPPQMLAVIKLTANRVALEWIDANFPQAWFRPMFET